MAKTADIGSKRLISLAPDTWVRWLTGDPTAEAVDFPSGEFEWVARATDVLLKARSPRHGTFLIANEIQFRPDARMPQRIRAYAALAEERYALNVYPVVINILPSTQQEEAIPDSYHSEFMSVVAHQDYKVVNLWEVNAAQVVEQRWMTLLPFVPILKGGDDKALVSKALALLRADERLAEMETFLAFFATFVMTSEEVRKVMRWDMAILRESPWYNEIVKEGLEQGLEQGHQQGLQEGQAEMLIFVFNRRFGAPSSELARRIRSLGTDQLRQLADVAISAPSLDAVVSALAAMPAATTKAVQYWIPPR